MPKLPCNVTVESGEYPDFILEVDSMWVTVENLSVHIIKKETGVSVRVYPKGNELADALDRLDVEFLETEE